MISSNNRILLDCTLRDGGYVNNWEFDTDTCLKVIDSLYESGIRYIELGLMAGKAIVGKQTKFTSFDELKPLLVNKKDDCKYCVMVTQAEYSKVNFNFPKRTSDSVDVIRLAYFKPELDEAIETAKYLKTLGYEVFLQAMATFLYSKDELDEMISRINEIEPHAFYMVDSFSTLYNEDIREMKEFVLKRLNKDIMFGLHAHNNIQMGYSNAIEFIKEYDEHVLMIDGSIYGMGRGAGNVPIELLMEYFNKFHKMDYKVEYIMSCFQNSIKPIFDQLYWGYSMPYYITATNDVNSVYGWYLDNKGIKDLKQISDIIKRIPDEAKYTLMKDVIDKVINEYQMEK